MNRERVKIERTLQKIPDKSLQELAYDWLRRNMPSRKTSEAFANDNPKLAITDTQLKLCYMLHKNECTLRQIERIMHLAPAGGNNAFRCIKLYERKLLEEQVKQYEQKLSEPQVSQKPIEMDFAKAILEILTVPVENRKEKLQQVIRSLPA